MITPKLAIHSGKIFKAVRGGVKIFDAHTMQWRFVANTWYDGKLDEVFQNRTARIKARNTSIFLDNWAFLNVPIIDIKTSGNKKLHDNRIINWDILQKGCFPFGNIKVGDQFKIAFNH